MNDNNVSENTDNFKAEFKYYKQKASTPCFDDVLNFENESSMVQVSKLCVNHLDAVENIKSSREWDVFHVNSVPGLYFIKNAFSEKDQLFWVRKCTQNFTRSPYVTNLDQFQEKSSVDDIWEKSSLSFCTSTHFHLNDLKQSPLWSLRWSTLGYHHDWNTKQYQKSHKTEFPHDLANVCTYIANVLGFHHFCPEASIVNFYHVGSTLSPHQDVSEADLSLPLVSISFGLDSIFLIGDDTKYQKPEAILIRSGDVIVMSGKSRTAYHALPRVMPSSRLTLGDEKDFLSFYLQHSRINLNVRQVESANLSLP